MPEGMKTGEKESRRCLILKAPRGKSSEVESRERRRPGEDGGVAQMGEHLPCKQGVDSSNLFISTSRESG